MNGRIIFGYSNLHSTCTTVCTGVGKRLHRLTSHPTVSEPQGYQRTAAKMLNCSCIPCQLWLSPLPRFFLSLSLSLSLSPHYKHKVSTGRTHQTYLSRCHFNDDTAQTPDVCSPAVTTLVVLCDDLWGHVGCKRKQHCNTLKLPQNCFFKDLYVSICGWSRGGGCTWVCLGTHLTDYAWVTNGD